MYVRRYLETHQPHPQSALDIGHADDAVALAAGCACALLGTAVSESRAGRMAEY